MIPRRTFLRLGLCSALGLTLSSCNMGHEGSLPEGTTLERAVKLAVEKYDHQILMDSLERIHLWLEKNIPAIADSLRPGLKREEIDQKTSKLPFKLPREVYDLYMWRDGTDEMSADDWPADDWPPFIWYHRFMSLDRAMREYENLAGFPSRLLYGWKRSWFPLFDYQEEYYYISCSSRQSHALSVWHYLLEDPSDVLSFTNLTTMMQTAAKWYESGAVRIDGEGDLNVDLQKLSDIHISLNPGASFPFRVS